MHAVCRVSKAVPGFVEPERWSGRGAKATKRNIWSFKVMLFKHYDIDFFYYNIRLKESGWLSRYRTLSAISVQKLKFIIFQMGTFSHGRMLQCGHSNHERYGFIFTLFVLFFHLFCSYFLNFSRTNQSHLRIEAMAQTFFSPFFRVFIVPRYRFETFFGAQLHMYSTE